MSYANIVAQIFFTVIIITALVYTQFVNESALKQQSELFEEQKQQLLSIASTDLTLVDLYYNITWSATKFVLENTGSQSINTTAMTVYLNGRPINRTYLQQKGFICVNLNNTYCGEIRKGSNPFHTNENLNHRYIYHFNNDSQYGESSSTVADMSTNSNTATVFGATHAQGKFDLAFYYDGDDYINIPSAGTVTFTNTTSYTYSVWVRPTAYVGDNTILSKNNGNAAAGGQGYQIYIDSQGYLNKRSRFNSNNFNSSYQIPIDVWTHIAIVYLNGGGGTNAFYVNGDLVANIPHNSLFRTQSNQPANIGRNRITADSFFIGYIDELAVFNVAKNQADVRLLYYKGLQFINSQYWDPQERFELMIYEPLASGTHTVRIVLENGYEKEYSFTR